MINAVPDIKALKSLCKKKLPGFVWDYLDSATGQELVKASNSIDLNDIFFDTNILSGDIDPQIDVTFDGLQFKFPLGVAPVGMSGLIHPNAEIKLAKAAVKYGFPYVLSTVAACSVERLASSITVDENIWFQLYCPRDKSVLKDLLKRVAFAGIETLVVTVDLPGASVRERQIKSGLTIPPSFNKKVIIDSALSPVWAIKRLINGIPEIENLTRYSVDSSAKSSTGHIGYQLRVNPTIDYLREVRRIWNGRIIIKGVSSVEHVRQLESEDIQGLWISNHAGRQFDGHPSLISRLPLIRNETKIPLIVDGGFDSGLNVLRGYALGADLVMSGSAWHYSLGALGDKGPEHLVCIIKRDLRANMEQIGLNWISEASTMLLSSCKSQWDL